MLFPGEQVVRQMSHQLPDALPLLCRPRQDKMRQVRT
jgi:hypothetical protein